VVDVLQLVATPDKQTPEKCAFPTSLFFEMLVAAVLQPAYAFALRPSPPGAVKRPQHFP
jgi:hypothetical protein